MIQTRPVNQHAEQASLMRWLRQGTVAKWLQTDVRTFAAHILEDPETMQELERDWDEVFRPTLLL